MLQLIISQLCLFKCVLACVYIILFPKAFGKPIQAAGFCNPDLVKKIRHEFNMKHTHSPTEINENFRATGEAYAEYASVSREDDRSLIHTHWQNAGA